MLAKYHTHQYFVIYCSDTCVPHKFQSNWRPRKFYTGIVFLMLLLFCINTVVLQRYYVNVLSVHNDVRIAKKFITSVYDDVRIAKKLITSVYNDLRIAVAKKLIIMPIEREISVL